MQQFKNKLVYLYRNTIKKKEVMKKLIETTKDKKEIVIRFNENTLQLHGSDYKKINEDNFDIYRDGRDFGYNFTEYKVGNMILRKIYPTWLQSGKVYICK